VSGSGPFLGLVPARGRSKSIPRKNVRDFAGRPLLAWTIDAAQASGSLDRVLCSTDDEEIAQVARDCGAEVPFLRPAGLAEDTTPTAPVVRHALDSLREHDGFAPRYVMVLEPTSPARRPHHVREAARLLADSGADSLASVSVIPHHYVPEKLLRLAGDGTIAGVDGRAVGEMVHRRQDLPTYHAFNGLVFACRAELLRADPPTLWGERVLGYVIDACYAVDLDEMADWAPAEARLREILAEEEERRREAF
jgi:CMP-N-acetylneuraminic acid synthetase